MQDPGKEGMEVMKLQAQFQNFYIKIKKKNSEPFWCTSEWDYKSNAAK